MRLIWFSFNSVFLEVEVAVRVAERHWVQVEEYQYSLLFLFGLSTEATKLQRDCCTSEYFLAPHKDMAT